MDGIDEFHAHLDVCRQCRENPFGLCWIGERLLLRAVVMPVMGSGQKAEWANRSTLLSRKDNSMNETEFNNKFPVGTPVRYHPVIGQPEYIETETRSEAWTLDSGQVIVKVKGRAGGVSIAAIEAVEQLAPADGGDSLESLRPLVEKLYGYPRRH